MVTALVILIIVLLLAAGVIGYMIERARQQESANAPLVIDLRPLPQERVRDYRSHWVSAQAAFADDADGAVRTADALVERLMAERGYPPVQSPDESGDDLAGLPREQAEVLQHYWAGHEIAVADEHGDADTDALRRAMVHYRMVFTALLESAARQDAE